MNKPLSVRHDGILITSHGTNPAGTCLKRKVRSSEGIRCYDCANIDTFMKLGLVEDNHLRVGKTMGDKFENK